MVWCDIAADPLRRARAGSRVEDPGGDSHSDRLLGMPGLSLSTNTRTQLPGPPALCGCLRVITNQSAHPAADGPSRARQRIVNAARVTVRRGHGTAQPEAADPRFPDVGLF